MAVKLTLNMADKFKVCLIETSSSPKTIASSFLAPGEPAKLFCSRIDTKPCKRQRDNPKFYFFDTGVQRALNNTLTVELRPQAYAFGLAFEHFVINEINRLQSYTKKDYRFSYLRTKDGVEIDLIIERPRLKRALVEIKSTERVTEDDVRPLQRLGKNVVNSETFCLSRDSTVKKVGDVLCFPWQRRLEEIGL